MTTVAFDGKILAADTLAVHTNDDVDRFCLTCNTCTEEVGADISKIHLYEKEVSYKGQTVIATARLGSAIVSKAMDTSLELGQLNEETLEIVFRFLQYRNEVCDATLAIWTRESFWVVRIIDGKFSVTEVTQFPWEGGSGGYVAMTAMKYMGLNATDALAIATDIDYHSGGPVESVVFKDNTYSLVKTEYTASQLEQLKKLPSTNPL